MIQIIGAGAIGCLWLAKLQQSGQDCHIVSRSSFSGDKLSFTDRQGERHIFNISHSQTLLHNSLTSQQSIILVCVKAPQVLDALLKQQQYIRENQIIILMHNGYGCAELVEQHFPNNPIICATTANASLLNKALDITHTGSGPSYFGLFKNLQQSNLDLANNTHVKPSEAIQADIASLLNVMPNSHWVDNIIEKCWLKLIINAVINPITAIHQINNGQLQCQPHSTLIQPLLLEAFEIAQAEQQPFELLELEKIVDDVILATAENYSSMNRDIFYERQTEIEFINGYLIKKAQQHNIETPILKDLYQQIKWLEHR